MTKLTEAQKETELLRAIIADRHHDVSNGERVGRLMKRGLVKWLATGPEHGWYLTDAGRAALKGGE